MDPWGLPPVRVPSQRPLAPSVASVTSVANDKDDDEMIQGAVHRSPDICLTTEEYPGKLQLGDHTNNDSTLIQLYPKNDVSVVGYYTLMVVSLHDYLFIYLLHFELSINKKTRNS